jgi:hypothetical protein
MFKKQHRLFSEYGKLTPMDKKTLSTLEYHTILAALADQCHFNPARERAAQLQPLTNLDQVRVLQEETAEAIPALRLEGREICARSLRMLFVVLSWNPLACFR